MNNAGERARLACKRLTPRQPFGHVSTYQQRPAKPIERYARRVGMDEIEKEGYYLNISCYISSSVAEVEIDLAATHDDLVAITEFKALQTNTTGF